MSGRQERVAVRTTDGAFSSERAVVLELADGQEVSLYADKDLINKQADTEYLRVSVVKSDAVAKTKTVLLPSETFETMTRWATVAQDKVV
jgi:hypothetical protein